MARNPLMSDASALSDVLDALGDPDCRTIIGHLEKPRSATELSGVCEIPLSTMYRKLELLSDASLLKEHTRINTDGQHTILYAIAFDAVRFDLDEKQSVSVAITRRREIPERRELASESTT